MAKGREGGTDRTKKKVGIKRILAPNTNSFFFLFLGTGGGGRKKSIRLL